MNTASVTVDQVLKQLQTFGTGFWLIHFVLSQIMPAARDFSTMPSIPRLASRSEGHRSGLPCEDGSSL
jgi:hypothetical protein